MSDKGVSVRVSGMSYYPLPVSPDGVVLLRSSVSCGVDEICDKGGGWAVRAVGAGFLVCVSHPDSYPGVVNDMRTFGSWPDDATVQIFAVSNLHQALLLAVAAAKQQAAAERK